LANKSDNFDRYSSASYTHDTFVGFVFRERDADGETHEKLAAKGLREVEYEIWTLVRMIHTIMTKASTIFGLGQRLPFRTGIVMKWNLGSVLLRPV
jgi:hypothetical protein